MATGARAEASATPGSECPIRGSVRTPDVYQLVRREAGDANTHRVSGEASKVVTHTGNTATQRCYDEGIIPEGLGQSR